MHRNRQRKDLGRRRTAKSGGFLRQTWPRRTSKAWERCERGVFLRRQRHTFRAQRETQGSRRLFLRIFAGYFVKQGIDEGIGVEQGQVFGLFTHSDVFHR